MIRSIIMLPLVAMLPVLAMPAHTNNSYSVLTINPTHQQSFLDTAIVTKYPSVLTFDPHRRPRYFYSDGHIIHTGQITRREALPTEKPTLSLPMIKTLVLSESTFTVLGSPLVVAPQTIVETAYAAPTQTSTADHKTSAGSSSNSHVTSTTSSSPMSSSTLTTMGKHSTASSEVSLTISKFTPGRHCPYPYPDETCHSPTIGTKTSLSATAMKTEKATTTSKVEATSSAKDDCPYPGQKC